MIATLSTSGSDDFNLTAEEVVQEIAEKLALIPIGGQVPGEVYTSIVRSINLMLKGWQVDGIYLNLERDVYVFTNEGQTNYQLGSSGADRAVTSYNLTTISSDEASGQTTLSVSDSSNMTVGDVIGIELDDNTLHWTTVTVLPNTTSVTINSALPSDAGTNNNVYTYASTAVITKPLEISSVRVRTGGDEDNEVKVYDIPRRRYFNIPNKTVSGTPIQYYVDKQNLYTKLYIYPTSSAVSKVLAVSTKRKLEDIDSSTDDFDLPQEWLETIVYNGCVACSDKFGKAQAVSEVVSGSTSIASKAAMSYKKLKNSMQEYTSIKFRPWIRR